MKKIDNFYRPEIDGLRAIAVIAVIFFHSNFLNLKGGYLGVDIFFIISGYLITRIILKELNNKKFSFINFYIRRIKRILPALYTVIFLTMPVAILFFYPSDLLEFGYATISTIFFYVNYFLYFTGIEYNSDNSQMPYLHLWSLAIEEQFYIFFPLIFILLNKFFNKYLLNTLLIITLISIAITHYYASLKYKDAEIFFLPQFRFWELLLGSLLAKIEDIYGRKEMVIFKNILPLLGIFMIISSFIFFDEKTIHPSFQTLIPLIGAMIFIWFSNKDDIITKILSKKFVVGIGLISYSLYLWHYPVFIFGRLINFDSIIPSGPRYTDFKDIYLIIFSFLLAILTYFFIENPFRKIFKTQHVIVTLGIVSLLIFSISYMIIENKGFPKRDALRIFNKFNNVENIPYEGIDKEIKYIYNFDNENIKNKTLIYKEFPNFILPNKKNVLFWGNSHADDLFYAFDKNKELFRKFEFSVAKSVGECLVSYLKNIKCMHPDDLTQQARELVDKSEIFVISPYYTPEIIFELDEIIRILKNLNKNVILVSNMPAFPLFRDKMLVPEKWTLIDVFVYKNNRLPNQKETLEIKKQYFEKKNISTSNRNNLLKKLAEIHNIIFLDREELICSKKLKYCEFFDKNNNKLIYDSDHFSEKGLIYLGQKIYDLDWFNID